MKTLLILLPLLALVALAWRVRRTPLSTRGQVNANHAGMARWIDHQMTLGLVSTVQADEARKLLTEYYGGLPKEIT